MHKYQFNAFVCSHNAVNKFTIAQWAQVSCVSSSSALLERERVLLLRTVFNLQLLPPQAHRALGRRWRRRSTSPPPAPRSHRASTLRRASLCCSLTATYSTSRYAVSHSITVLYSYSTCDRDARFLPRALRFLCAVQFALPGKLKHYP